MKPTPLISSDRSSRGFPLTDYSFQPTTQATAVSPSTVAGAKPAAFHTLSSEVFAKSSAELVAELCGFAAIIGIAAMSILPMLACLAWMKIVI
jgi:hypothetical protein